MSCRNLNALIVEDTEHKQQLLNTVIKAMGGIVVATLATMREIEEMHRRGELRPGTVDAIFLDSDLGDGPDDGGAILDFLIAADLARTPTGDNQHGEPVVPNPNKLVTIGSSSEPDWARRIGSYSDRVGGPLMVDWGAGPYQFPGLIEEIYHLKPLPPIVR